MKRSLAFIVVGGAAVAFWVGGSTCAKSTASGPSAGQADPTHTLLPADLGPDTVDVTGYPEPQQANYELFVAKCSGCHTLARAINSTIVDAATWKRYVTRMHLKSEARVGGTLLTPAEGKRVISFLVHDGRERKIKDGEKFQALQADLKARFERTLALRDRQKGEADRTRARESSPYVGDR